MSLLPRAVLPSRRLFPAVGRALLFFGLLFGPLAPAFGQTDTTATGPPGSSRPPADTTVDPPSFQPRPFAPPPYGRPQTDSLPARLPHVSLAMMIAEQPGSFLYDLGAIGWPHGWSPRGLAPHRTHLWLDGRSFDDPLTGRARFELLPPSFLERPRTGVDPGGGAVGVHTAWRAYPSQRPITEIRYRWDNYGLHAIETAHSQKRRLDLFGAEGLLQATFGYGGRKADGVYNGSALRRERRIWGRLRYQTENWTVELTDQSSRHRIGAHGGVKPPGTTLQSIYILPLAASSVRNPDAHRQTFRNDLTVHVQAPLLPGLTSPLEASASWISNTFDFRTDFEQRDTTWTVKLNGAHARLRQSLKTGRHTLTLGARGSLWSVAESNVPQPLGSRGAVHLLARDSLRLGSTRLVLDASGHLTSEQWYPAAALRATRPVGSLQMSASLRSTGQRSAWIEQEGFADLVRPLSSPPSGITDRLLEATATLSTTIGAFDVEVQGFAHQIREAVDLYADVPANQSSLSSITDTVVARQTETPVRRAGATLHLSWRRDTPQGLYATAQGTLLATLNAQASTLHTRLARTLPTAYGRARLGARFVLFTDLNTDLYVQARGWTAMNSRWFHPPTGRLVVPPRRNPVPVAPGLRVGPSGTIDVRAEATFRGATLFFTFENVQASFNQPGSFERRATLHPGTFVVPVYPLPARQFRFGVFWPIFD